MKHLILFAASSLLCLVLLSGVVLAQVPTPERIADDSTKEWQLDFKKFVETLRGCANNEFLSNCPIATFKGAKVTWEGTFTSWDNKAMQANIDMGLDKTTLTIGEKSHKLLCCYPSVTDPAQWKTLAPGSKVKFQASLNTLIPIFIAKGQALILIEKATIGAPASNEEGQIKPQSDNAEPDKFEEKHTPNTTAVAEQMTRHF